MRVPPEFEQARSRLKHRIVWFGYVERFAEYARWLWRGDIVVSTALHEFFGAAVVEAIYCGCQPILPNRLTYPQFVPEVSRASCLYSTEDDLVTLLGDAVAGANTGPDMQLRANAAQYDWASMTPEYDRRIEEIRPSR